MTSAVRRSGGAFALLYAAVAVATFEPSPAGSGRPLFDGFAPPAPYNWVKPPPELAAGNRPPQGAERNVALGEQGSDASNISTPDAQILLTLRAGAIATRPPDTSVTVRVTPLDAGTLASLPPDRRPVANAYEVRLAYQPSQEPVTAVGPSAQVAMTASSQGDGLLYSSDGTTWQQAVARPFGNTHGMTGPFNGNGYYLVTASPAVATTHGTYPRSGGGGEGGGTGAALAGAAVAGAVTVAAVVGRSRMRSRRPHRRRPRRGRRP